MRFPANAFLTALLAAVLAIAFSLTAFADEHDLTREERSAQLIFNTAHMSPDAGTPTPELIARYRLQDVGNVGGPQFTGFGQRPVIIVEDGERVGYGFGVAFGSDGGGGDDRHDRRDGSDRTDRTDGADRDDWLDRRDRPDG